MRSLRAWFKRVGGVFRSGRREQDLKAEIESHLQLHIDDNLRAGMTLEEARRAARLKFGQVEAIKDTYRERASIHALDIALQDLRYGLRRLRRQPAATALIAATLGLGVGANAAMLNLVDILMFRTPAHVQAPDRIVTVGGPGHYVRYQELRDRLQSVEVAALTRQTLSFGRGRDARPLRVECVTPSYFPLLGVAPRIGRAFTDVDDGSSAPGTIVLSHAFWSRELGADPAVLSRVVTVGDRQYQVIGIAPNRFSGVDLGAVDAWIVLAASPEACSFVGRNLLRSSAGSWLEIVGRLRDDVSLPAASAELAALQPAATPGGAGALPRNASLMPRYEARRPTLSQDSRIALWLSGGAGALLLLACVNVAGLFWAGTIARGREIGVRLQLGASRRRMAAQLLVECVLYAAAGALVALLVARWLGDAILRFFPFGDEVAVLDSRMVLIVGGVAFASGILSGLVPALHAIRTPPDRHLRTRHVIAGGRIRLRTLLLAAQVALAIVLVVAAGLFVQSVQNFRQDFAYDLERVVVATIDYSRSHDTPPHEVHATYRLLLDRVRQLPEVEATALSSARILDREGMMRAFGISRAPKDSPIIPGSTSPPSTSRLWASV